MSIKSFFDNSSYALKSLSQLTSSVESADFVVEKTEYKKKVFPNINFEKPSLFCKYGLAKEYYSNSFYNIYTNFPYDGSKKEKLAWENDLSYIDQYVFDNIYPKYYGHVFFPEVTGTEISIYTGMDIDSSLYDETKYIKIKSGGPNVDNKYISGTLENNLKVNPANGMTIQFWMKKDSFTAAYQNEFICDFVAMSSSYSNVNKNVISIYLDNTNKDILSFGVYPILANQSLSTGFDIDNGEWNHYTLAVNYSQGDDVLTSSLFVNGKLTDTDYYANFSVLTFETEADFAAYQSELSGAIGATTVGRYIDSMTVLSASGYNQLCDTYIDEFRFWSRKLTEEEIYKNWFVSINGGKNTDTNIISSSISVYYKFNEGKTLTSSIDSIVLDYSGRNTNATFINYSSDCRITSSAYVEYGLIEEKDPIIYSFHPDVAYTKSYYEGIGSSYDDTNDDSFYRMFPSHIQEDDYDAGNHFLKLSHIIGSYFDEVLIQTKALTTTNSNRYNESGSYNSEIYTRLLSSYNVDVTGLFDATSASELFNNSGDQYVIEKNIEKIKANIYKNLYNNLISTYKSKGTENSIKSIFRSFGVDDELIKIKAYANNDLYNLNDFRHETYRKKNILDLTGLNRYENIYACVYPYMYSSDGSEASAFEDLIGISEDRQEIGVSLETTVSFPKNKDILNSNYIKLPEQYLSASIMGMIPLADVDYRYSNVATWNMSTNLSGCCVFIAKKSNASSLAKFILKLTGSGNSVVAESDYYNVFNNTQWTLCLTSTGSIEGVQSTSSDVPVIVLRCVESNGGDIVNSFAISASMASSTRANAFSCALKPYIGALRQDFSGSLVCPTQAQFLSSRAYMSFVNQQTVENHAVDVFNYGISGTLSAFNYGASDPFYSFAPTVDYVGKYNTCLFSWDFQNLTGSGATGALKVFDITSGSKENTDLVMYQNDEYIRTLNKKMNGFGYGFGQSDTDLIQTTYVQVAKNKEINNLYSNKIFVQDNEDIYFNRDINPVKYYYTIENSMYAVISEEILNMFADMTEFSDLIGQDYYKYRETYKSLEKLREFFFRRISDVKKVDTYIRYYKWFDSNIGKIVRQIIPLSLESSEGVFNIIESHALERNKIKYYESYFRNKETSFESSFINYRSNWTPASQGEKIDKETWVPTATPTRVLKIH